MRLQIRWANSLIEQVTSWVRFAKHCNRSWESNSNGNYLNQIAGAGYASNQILYTPGGIAIDSNGHIWLLQRLGRYEARVRDARSASTAKKLVTVGCHP
jgi:hypothetical protein